MIKKLTDDEINALAEDIYKGNVFTSNQIRKEDLNMLPMIFMPLALAGPKLIEDMKKEDIGMIYEHFSEAGPRCVNSYPTFVSLHIVSQEETKKIWEKYAQIKKAVEGITKQSNDGIEA